MNEQKLHVEVFVDGEHKLGGKEYVQGRIHGIMSVICETYRDRRFGLRELAAGTVMNVYCTAEEYVRLKTRLQEEYRDLCRVNIRRIVED